MKTGTGHGWGAGSLGAGAGGRSPQGAPGGERRGRWHAARAAAAVPAAAALVLAGCGGAGHTAAAGSRAPGTSARVATRGANAGKGPATAGSRARAYRSVGPATFNGPDGVEARWVVAENAKPGTTAWHLSGTGGASINGFANMVAASAGQKVTFYVTTHASRYHVSAYRMGYYGGKGGRLVWSSPELTGTVQPQCTLATATRMVACDNWSPSFSVTIGRQFVQGDYLFKLVADPGQQSYVPLTVWDPASHSTYLVQNSVLTWQGWNTWGGYDMYGGAPPGQSPQYSQRAYVESFDRPYANGNGAADFMALEYPLVYWAEQHGLDVSYWTDVTFSEHPGLLKDHRALLTLGHDETWTLQERDGVVAARTEGVNVVYFGASPVLRHARLQPSPMGPDREEVDYRDPQLDPVYATDPLNATGDTWAQPPANLPPSEVVGDTYEGYGLNDPMVVTGASSWPFAGTGLTNGMQLPGVIAGDYDSYNTASPNPPNVEVLAHSPVHPQVGNSPYSDMTYYTWAKGGGGVLATGTIGWIPALESCKGPLPACPSKAVQAVTGNILALFGKGPAGRYHPSVANWQRYYG